jgi:hypothetical protein
MYASMNTENLTIEALKRPVGSLAFELVDAIGGDMDELTTENEQLETQAEKFSICNIDNCEEMVFRIEQVESRLQDMLETIPDHQAKGSYADMQYTVKDCLALLDDAVIYFNNQQKAQS